MLILNVSYVQQNYIFRFFSLIILGNLSMLFVSYNEQKKSECYETIEKIQVDNFTYASCDAEKSLSYIYDINGDRYIVCKCKEDIKIEFPQLDLREKKNEKQNEKKQNNWKYL